MNKKAFFYIILAGVLWGTSGIFVHFLAPYGFTSFQMTSIRGWVSFLCLLVYALIRNKGYFRVKPIRLLLFLGIGLSLFLTASCYFLSMQMTSVSTAVVLMYTAPIYVMIFSVLFLREKFTKLKLVSIVCMLVGCILVSGVIKDSKWNAAGILIGILSGLAYAAYNILTKIAMRYKLEPISVTLYSFLFMSLISLFVLEPTELWTSISKAPAVTVPLLLSLGIVTFVLPYLLYTLAVKVLPVGISSALSIVEPMAATLFSVFLFREALDLFGLIGIILILFAVFLIGRQQGKEA